MHPNVENMIVVPIRKRMEIIISIKVCPILWVNINYKEKKSFFANPMNQYRVSQCGEHDRSANDETNGDYYRYPSLYHFINELQL